MIARRDFWDELAPYHAALEDNYFDRSSLRAIAHQILAPVLVVGAGQGLHVAELRRRGLRCDGVDRSSEMVRYAVLRRGISLLRADARALPFGDRTYRSILYATGVIDCIEDEEAIRAAVNEGRRVVSADGAIFVAFYRLSAALASFLERVGLLRDNVLSQREAMRLYTWHPTRTTLWVAERAGTGLSGAALALLRAWMLSSRREKQISSRMRRMLARMEHPEALIEATPERQPYRDDVEILDLFERLAIPIRELLTFASCHVVRLV